MDTKSKNFKYSFAAKAICFLLSAVFFFLSVFSCASIIIASYVYGFNSYFNGSSADISYSELFKNQFLNDIINLRTVAASDTSSIEAVFAEQSKSIINGAVNSFLDKKAKIIEDELRYAVENYDDSYFNYEYTADSVTLPNEYYAEYATAYSDNAEDGGSVPKNIELAQIILGNAKGREFLNYEALVRTDAFTQSFSYEYTITLNSDTSFNLNLYTEDMNLSENQASKDFTSQYNDNMNAVLYSLDSAYEANYSLSLLKNFKYYLVAYNDKVYKNIDFIPSADSLDNYKISLYSNSVNAVINGILNPALKDSISSLITGESSFKEMYIFLENDLNESNDAYSEIFSVFNNYDTFSAQVNLAILIISFISAVVFLVLLLMLCGHKNGTDTPVTAYIDRLPSDLHLILSLGIIVGTVFLALAAASEVLRSNYFSYILSDYGALAFALAGAFCFAVFTECLASAVRIKKAGLSILKNTLIGKIFISIFGLLKKLKAIFSYTPRIFHIKFIFLTAGYVLINAIFSFLGSMAILYTPLSAIVVLLVMIAFNALCAVFTVKYIYNLDKIIDASCRHENVDFGSEKVPKSLALLAMNLTNANYELSEAVAKAVRDEQMKTELITNVSHDLKTPLTSLITYSDLLKSCDITDEKAKKYISVINKQSFKLKRLIEDLIEASKVSTGNVTLNKSVLNLSELTAQAIAEFAPEMEANGNTIIFNQPETPPEVFADGSKTYRIISNLLSNAKKYSAADTRVYISVYGDGKYSYFEIKNISCEPLNISPDELTERFVRGDQSRTREGNGLGLSIAKDLCLLQDGELKIIIDGDLFKAIVQLPAKDSGRNADSDNA